VRKRVIAARRRQLDRYERGETSARENAALPARELERVAALDGAGKKTIEAAMCQLGLSARAFVRVLRVARTIADLEREPAVRASHVTEALAGRLLDREAFV
jgi:magnesium chelatase family protein